MRDSGEAEGSKAIAGRTRHLAVLDGWRGISILLVLGAHLLPLGPRAWSLNLAAASAGMALFFCLSGFLIVSTLIESPAIGPFLIRRLVRILPLSWVAFSIGILIWTVDPASYLPNFLFYANLPPLHLTFFAAHYWSLDVEVQFYVGIALLVGVFGRRGLLAIPLLCLAVTAHRIAYGAQADIVTWRRVDEILAGGVLALVLAGHLGGAFRGMLSQLNVPALILLFVISSLPASGGFNSFRAYAAAALVGATLQHAPKWLSDILRSKSLAYLARVSFALYIIHGIFQESWLGNGNTVTKYAKRPLLFALTFALAHLSSFYFERYFVAMGRRIVRSIEAARRGPPS